MAKSHLNPIEAVRTHGMEGGIPRPNSFVVISDSPSQRFEASHSITAEMAWEYEECDAPHLTKPRCLAGLEAFAAEHIKALCTFLSAPNFDVNLSYS